MTKKLMAGENVFITYQGDEMKAVVIDCQDDGLVWVRSHSGNGRALGYKAKDVRRKPLHTRRKIAPAFATDWIGEQADEIRAQRQN